MCVCVCAVCTRVSMQCAKGHCQKLLLFVVVFFVCTLKEKNVFHLRSNGFNIKVREAKIEIAHIHSVSFSTINFMLLHLHNLFDKLNEKQGKKCAQAIKRRIKEARM